MTDAQLATLKAAILADTDPDVAAAVAIRNDTEIARLYNLPSAFVVWRTSVPPEEYKAAITWTEVDALQPGKARIWEWLTARMTVAIDASKTAIRNGITDCWGVGTATRPALIAIAKRFATNCEKVFATGTGTDGSPGTLVWEGSININDIGQAMNLP